MGNISLKIEGKLARVILDRAEKHNAFNDQTIKELSGAFDEIEKNDNVRAVLLESTGKSFSAGGDLAWMKKTKDYTESENLNDANALADMLYKLNYLSKPTVAKIQGPAFGGGVGLVACCDIAIAADTAKFCLSEVRLGLSPATISPYVIKAMGASQARRYFLTAERFDAATAARINLVHEVCEPSQLDEKVDKILSHLMAGGPEALGIAKDLIYLTEPMVNDEILEKTAQQIARQRVTKEGQEGLGAFFEKRPAAWTQDAHP